MIDYDRGSWYGIHLLFRLRGSLLPRCVPAALLGACIAGGVELAEAYCDGLKARALICSVTEEDD